MQASDTDMLARLGIGHAVQRCLLLVLCLLLPFQAAARPLILLSETSELYQHVSEEIKRAYQQPLDEYSTETFPAQSQQGMDLSVAVGAKACELLLQRSSDSSDLVCTFIPRASFDALIALYGSDNTRVPRRITAVYLDQPLPRQLHLARLLKPQAKSVGTMFGPFSADSQPLFLQAAAAEQLIPVSITLKASDNPVEQLKPLIQQSDVFLALPDRALFNRATAKWLLYITLQQQIPVIGFSRTYVEAGALAAVYSTPRQIGRQTGELLHTLTPSRPLPAPAYPKYFNVSSNPVVARSLHLPVPDDSVLLRALTEGAP